MSAGYLVLLVIPSVVAVAAWGLILITVAGDIKQWRARRAKAKESPPQPTLHEVYAADMEHWGKRFYAVLEAALPGVCDCDPYPFSCPIHARSPEKTYDLRGIHRHIENNRQRDERRRARENR